jgi:hypothetical protein
LARCCGGTGNLNLNFKLGHYSTEKKAEIFTEFVPDDLFKGGTDEVESPRYVGIEMRSAEEVENPEEEVQDEIEEEPVVRRERGRPRLVRTGARGRPRKVCRFQEARTAEIEEEAFISVLRFFS